MTGPKGIKRWRPELWADANEAVFRAGTMLSTAEVYELGADAMLKALKKELKNSGSEEAKDA